MIANRAIINTRPFVQAEVRRLCYYPEQQGLWNKRQQEMPVGLFRVRFETPHPPVVIQYEVQVIVRDHHPPAVHADDVQPDALGKRHPDFVSDNRDRGRPKPIGTQPFNRPRERRKRQDEPHPEHAPDRCPLKRPIQRFRTGLEPPFQGFPECPQEEELDKPGNEGVSLRQFSESLGPAQGEHDNCGRTGCKESRIDQTGAGPTIFRNINRRHRTTFSIQNRRHYAGNRDIRQAGEAQTRFGPAV